MDVCPQVTQMHGHQIIDEARRRAGQDIGAAACSDLLSRPQRLRLGWGAGAPAHILKAPG